MLNDAYNYMIIILINLGLLHPPTGYLGFPTIMIFFLAVLRVIAAGYVKKSALDIQRQYRLEASFTSKRKKNWSFHGHSFRHLHPLGEKVPKGYLSEKSCYYNLVLKEDPECWVWKSWFLEISNPFFQACIHLSGSWEFQMHARGFFLL